MNVQGWWMAWQSLRWHWGRSLTLVLCLAVTAFLPMAVGEATELLDREWRARAEATPLVIGPRGSRVDLMLHALYHRPGGDGTLDWRDVEAIRGGGLAAAVPVYTRHTAGRHAVVGTTVDYFARRGLVVAEGRGLLRLGEAVAGARAAARLGIAPGARVITDPENPFRLAGAYPLRLAVVGVLAPTGTADDDALFVDIKTAWIISGIGHGHDDVTAADADPAMILSREGGRTVANAALPAFNEVTPANIDSFHFHAADDELPVTTILAWPRDARAGTILRGRYLDTRRPQQALVPREVVGELLDQVFRVARWVQSVLVLVGAAAGGLMALVVALSLRLRREEIETLAALGASRFQMAQVIVGELLILASIALVLALAGVAGTLALLRGATPAILG